ncbi:MULTISPECIES: aldo/keto reductase [Spirulina sp. CCY15215]|uniref:aldo/keto reductase n=1 Tax=Spirulina sp. CCY15215 TaxID=2767591 RepID=UPI00194E4B73|nr:aldo/keto reductase [Spirulina major]
MLYRRFGRTELQIPVFSCGGMRYQYKWQDVKWQDVPQDNQSNVEATIRRAVDLGINHIETARGYGSSEMQLGAILPKLPRDEIIVQTKVEPVADPQEFRQTFDRSLGYLKLDYVDLLGLHGINNAELLHYSLKPGGCLAEAKKLQAEGKVRFIGFSTHAPTEIIIEAIESGEFDYINLHWYYIFQDNWPAIEAARRQDMGIFIISPSNKGGMLYQAPQRLVELCQPLSPMVFNGLFCLSQPEVNTLSVGASFPTDFDEHLQVLDLLDRSDEILPPIIERLEREAIARLGKDWYLTWREGLPKPEETPGNINIPTVLWLRNLAIAYDLIEYGKMRYNLLGNGGHWFAGKKAQNIPQFDFTACLQNSPHRDKIPEFLAECDRLLGGEEIKRLSQQ